MLIFLRFHEFFFNMYAIQFYFQSKFRGYADA